MASNKPIEPVMHMKASECQKVCNLGKKLLSEGVFKFPLTFPNLPYTDLIFKPEVDKLDLLITECKGNSAKIAERDAQSKVVFKMMKKILLYCKIICGDSIDLINQSGFEPSAEPTAHTVPDPVKIKKIIRGTEAGTIRVMLEKFTGPQTGKKDPRTFIVRVYDTEDAKEFRVGCSETNSRKLIVRNVEPMKTFFYAVVVQNSAGINELASKVKFTLTD